MNAKKTSQTAPPQETVAVVGIGYVGLPAALAFGAVFPRTIGYDVDAERVAQLVAGRDTNGDMPDAAVEGSSVLWTTDAAELGAASCYLLTVPTPLTPEKLPDLSMLEAASRTVAKYLTEGDLVVVESTVYPGVTEDVVGAILTQESGLDVGTDFQLAYSPERINPGDREHTLDRVVKVVSGADDETLQRVTALYAAIVPAGVFQARSIKVAEAAKAFENTQRDVNIALMNELGLICDRLGIRTSEVLEAARTKWNFIDFQPGLVGGHCIGIDPYYLTAKAKQLGYHPEVMLAGRRINDSIGGFVAQRTVKLLADAGRNIVDARVGVLGLTFKEDFGDVRNSRVIDIIEELKRFGVDTLVHDPLVDGDTALFSFGIALVGWEALTELDALVIAVQHAAFRVRPTAELLATLKPDGVIVDVKSVLDPATLPDTLTYWSL